MTRIVSDFFKDHQYGEGATRLTDEQVGEIRMKAGLSLQLEPLPPGANDGLVYYKRQPWHTDPILAFDSNGHEAFAELVSNAQPWIVALASEVLRLREGLKTIAEGRHTSDCHRVARNGAVSEWQDVACDCHQAYAIELLEE